MKSNVMRGPLLKAGAVLLVFMLLVYFTSTSAEGSVWSSITMIVIGAVRLVQWAIGMVIGVVFCIAVLIGVFLGAVAIANKESAAQMYSALKVTIGEWLTCGIAAISGGKCEATASCAPESEAVQVVAETTQVDEIHSLLDSRLGDLTDKIQALESKMAAFASVDKLDKVAGEVNASGDALQKLHDVLAGLEERVEDAAGKLNDMSGDKLLGDLPHRVKTIEQQDVASKQDINSLVDLVERLQNEIKEGLSDVALPVEEAAVEQASGDDEDAHRLFSYFKDVADQQKIQKLVDSTLKKDMTYAQVMDLLVTEMGAEKGQIIAEHPSLAKDFIRQARRG